ncbi:RpiB/LacA/LacB family sugar-phosphate isomerase [Candidatus Marsarchaeota archaeon]|nr:RpiB/LacA/LacB family sugar-phosphate isomerase [Candidatus Marsarchaeota archaeon]
MMITNFDTGIKVKIYLAAEHKDLGIKLANAINRSNSTCIISDIDSEGYSALLRDIKGSLQGFDLSILISDSPHEASMEANRLGGIRATVCKDLEDVEAAMAANANLIVLDSAKLSRIDVRGMIKSFQDHVEPEQQKPQRKDAISYTPEKSIQVQPKPQIQQRPQQKMQPGGIGGSFKSIFGVGMKEDTATSSSKDIPKKKLEIKPKKPDVAQLQPKKKGRGGLFGSLKDTFGVE